MYVIIVILHVNHVIKQINVQIVIVVVIYNHLVYVLVQIILYRNVNHQIVMRVI